MAQRPGVMLYFDLRPSLKRLNLEEKGQLFEGILDYAEDGTLPDFEGILGVVWDFIQPRLDRDARAYEDSVLQRQFAVYCRRCKQAGSSPLDFEDWKLSLLDNERNHPSSSDNEPLPTTASPSTSIPTSTTASSTAGAGGAGGHVRKDTDFNTLRNEAIRKVLAFDKS